MVISGRSPFRRILYRSRVRASVSMPLSFRTALTILALLCMIHSCVLWTTMPSPWRSTAGFWTTTRAFVIPSECTEDHRVYLSTPQRFYRLYPSRRHPPFSAHLPHCPSPPYLLPPHLPLGSFLPAATSVPYAARHLAGRRTCSGTPKNTIQVRSALIVHFLAARSKVPGVFWGMTSWRVIGRIDTGSVHIPQIS